MGRQNYLTSMRETPINGKGVGLVVHQSHRVKKWTVLGVFVGRVKIVNDEEEVNSTEQTYTLEISAPRSKLKQTMYAPPSACILARLNEPSKGIRANCHLLRSQLSLPLQTPMSHLAQTPAECHLSTARASRSPVGLPWRTRT